MEKKEKGNEGHTGLFKESSANGQLHNIFGLGVNNLEGLGCAGIICIVL